jgi:Tfp pilus assembly protein PilV
MKDYESTLAKPAEIQFRTQQAIKQLPHEMAMYSKANGTPYDHAQVAAIKGDLDAKEQLDLWQYHYAASKGVHSYRSLPAVDKAEGAVKFLLANKHMTPSDARDAMAQIAQIKRDNSETEMSQMATDLWQYYPIGQIATQWKSTMKEIQPAPLQAGRG